MIISIILFARNWISFILFKFSSNLFFVTENQETETIHFRVQAQVDWNCVISETRMSSYGVNSAKCYITKYYYRLFLGIDNRNINYNDIVVLHLIEEIFVDARFIYWIIHSKLCLRVETCENAQRLRDKNESIYSPTDWFNVEALWRS